MEHVRMNMRYRGPMESYKMNAREKQTEVNLEQIKKRFEELHQNIQQLEEGVYRGAKESALEDPIPQRMTHMKRDLELVERGVARV